MKTGLAYFLVLAVFMFISGCSQVVNAPASPAVTSPAPSGTGSKVLHAQTEKFPKIASWLAKVDEIIAGNKPYDLLMSGWFTPEQAVKLRAQNSDVILLAGLTVNWVWDNQQWMTFLVNVASYGSEEPFTIQESMYLHQPDGKRVAFGWASEEWGQEEIYAMDPQDPGWADLIISFYKNVLDQPQHDGIIIDMMTEKSWCPEAISDDEWVESTKAILELVHKMNALHKPVILNAGRDLSEIDAYRDYMNGYLMENFMGTQLKTTFSDGLRGAGNGLMVIYAVDTDDTGVKDLKRMRLGLVLSMLFDNTYFTYDFGPRDHGQAWWFPEYGADLGKPLGIYYKQGEAYCREFEKGMVVAAPDMTVVVSFNQTYKDITSGEMSLNFTVEKGDARIYIKVN